MPVRQNLHEFLERKAESARRGESAAQKRLSDAEADLEIRRLERKNSEIALFMSLIENSNLKDYNHIKRINGLISLKEKRLTCVEFFFASAPHKDFARN